MELLTGSVFPKKQTISWNRQDVFSNFESLVINSSGAIIIDFSLSYYTTSVKWLSIVGVDDIGYLDSLTQQIVEVSVKNIDLLPNGIHQAKAYFNFVPLEGNSLEEIVEFNLILSGSSIKIETDKPLYNLTFNRKSNILSGDTAVGILNNTTGKALSFWQPSTIFEPKSSFTTGFTLEDNATTPMLLNPALPESGTVNHLCKILGPIGELVSNFTINLLILNDNGIGVNPSSLFFEVIKNTSEKTAVLSIINPLGLDFTVEAPAWLTPSVLLGNTSVDIDITTETSLLDPSTYNGIIKIVVDGSFIDVPVTLILKQFITINNLPYNFCLDIPPVLFTKINELARYVRITMSAKYTVMGVETDFNHSFIVPYIDSRAWFELGKKLHTYFPRFRNHLFEIAAPTEFLKAINCDLVLEELNIEYESLLSENLNGLKFFPGSEPHLFPILSNYGFRKKNKGTILFVTHCEGDLFLTEKITDTNLIDAVTHETKTVKLYEYPQVYTPIHMQWENQNLVPEWFTFTGEYSINSDFSHITSKNVINSLMEKFDTSKMKKLSINTGFILKEELGLVEEIIDSKIAFVNIKGQFYHCFNVTPKMIVASSGDTIIERDLEFIIVEK